MADCRNVASKELLAAVAVLPAEAFCGSFHAAVLPVSRLVARPDEFASDRGPHLGGHRQPAIRRLSDKCDSCLFVERPSSRGNEFMSVGLLRSTWAPLDSGVGLADLGLSIEETWSRH